MTGMTPERLDLIRDRIDHTGYAQWKNVTSELLDEVDRLRAENDNLRAGAKSFVRQIDRLANGIEALTRVGYDHTPDCVKEQESAHTAGETFWHPDCGRCWEDSLHDLLNPTEGEDPVKYPMKCPICSKEFDSMDSLADTRADVRAHMDRAHGADLDVYEGETDDHRRRH